MKIFLFVSSNCPHCPKAEAVIKSAVPEYYEQGINFEKIRVKTNEGKELSKKFNVMSLPTILMINDEGKEIKRIIGVPSKENLKKEIERNLGIKKSIFNKIFSGKS